MPSDRRRLCPGLALSLPQKSEFLFTCFLTVFLEGVFFS